MKNRVFNAFLLLAMVGMMFTACKKEYPQPPIQDLPVGRVYTIDEILTLESGTVFTEDASVYGIVTADEVSGNLYKCAFMQDRATGAAIELYLTAPSGVRIGDSIRVYLKDVTYSLYANLPQLTNFEADGHIIILANDKPIEPAKATITEINEGKYLAGLVRLENVKFTEQNTFSEPNTYGNRTLIDPMNPSNSVIVRTSNYANFAYDSLPQGVGNMTAIATVFNSTWQLLIRTARELEFDGYVPGGANDLPYCEFFSSSFGSYTTYDVNGAQHWEIDYSTAKMTGYENSTNYENEDWLISAKVSLENVSSACMTMSYIARYFNNVNDDITVWVSSDYTSGDPNLANWEQVPASWTEGSNWSDFASTTLDLSQFAGKKICVAVKYHSDNNKAGTIEVQSICIQEGSGPTPPPGPGTGGELQYLPYEQNFTSDFGTYMASDVLGPQSWVNQYETAKMSGYADGASNANEDWLISSPVLITAGIEHAKAVVNYAAKYQGATDNDVTMQVSTNYEFGADPTNATWAELPVTYPNNSSGNAWTFTDQEVSLDNYIGQTVTVAIKYTSTESASRTIEIKTITIQEGEAGGGVTPPGPGTGEGSGTADDPYNVAAGIGYQNQGDAWVKGYIVGAVKSGQEHNTVTSNDDIDWVAPFGRATNVLIADDASCNEIANCLIVKMPSGSALRSQVNLLDHPDNLGKQLTVFGTLKNAFGKPGLDSPGTENDFVFEGGDTPTPPEPGTGIFSETFANGQGDFVIQDVFLSSGLNYVWKHDATHHYMKASAYVGGPYASESWLVSPIIDLSNVATATLKFDQIVNYATSVSPNSILHVMVSSNYNGDVQNATWLELTLDRWPEGNNWNTVNSVADLAGVVGQQITIAFKYTSEAVSGKCPTWEVFNIVLE
jgi:hypothetical protein